MRFGSFILSFLFLLTTFLAADTVQPKINPDLLTKPWPARWIAHPSAPAKGYGVYHFRKHLQLTQKPEHFIIHVSADNRYQLFVNGQFVSDGPARGDLAHWRFETVDIAPQLKAGDNLMAAVVWVYGDYLPFRQMTYRSGFILQGDTPKEGQANTGASWKVFRNLAYSPIPETASVVGPFDRVDGGKYPWGWQEPQFDDAAWAAAKPMENGLPWGIGTGVMWALTPRPIPPMELRPQRFDQIRRTTGIEAPQQFLQGQAELRVPARSEVALLIDQSHLTTAYPELQVSGGKESLITVTYAEGLFDKDGKKGNRNEVEGRHIEGNRDEFLPDGGSKRLFRPIWLRAFRYVELKVKTGSVPLIIHNFSSQFTGYPLVENASFRSSDPSLSKIWEVGWRTARLCAGEAYYDCPYYEQLQYVGDTRIQSLISLYVAGDDRLMRNAIRQFDDSRIPGGLTQSRYPSSNPQIIPPFSLFWIGMIHDYWMHRDDPAFVSSLLQGIDDVLHWHETYLNPSGMLGHVPWWSFVDWPDQWPWDNDRNIGGEPSGVEEGNSSILTLQLVLALDEAADLAKAFHHDCQAAHYRELVERLKKATLKLCWDESRGLLADTPKKDAFSQHANLLAVLADLIPSGPQKILLEKTNRDPSLIQCTMYYRFYLYKAMKKAGLGDRYVEMLTPWQHMLQIGLTTFAERPEPTRSDCHAWSASPNYELLASVCGIEPAEPGFRSVRIAPHLGPLTWVKGVMPHPHGKIEVNLKRVGAEGLSGQVILPMDLSGELVWNNKTIPLKPGEQEVNLAERGR